MLLSLPLSCYYAFPEHTAAEADFKPPWVLEMALIKGGAMFLVAGTTISSERLIRPSQSDTYYPGGWYVGIGKL